MSVPFPFHGQEFHNILAGMSPAERSDFFTQQGFPYPVAQHMAQLPAGHVSYAYGMHPQNPHHNVWEGIYNFRAADTPGSRGVPGWERNVGGARLPIPPAAAAGGHGGSGGGGSALPEVAGAAAEGFYPPRVAPNMRLPGQTAPSHPGNHSEPTALLEAYRQLPGMPPLPEVALASGPGPYPYGRRDTAGDVVTETRERMGYGNPEYGVPGYQAVAAALQPGGRGGIVGTERAPCENCGPFLQEQAPGAEVSYLVPHTEAAAGQLRRDFEATRDLLAEHPVPDEGALGRIGRSVKTRRNMWGPAVAAAPGYAAAVPPLLLPPPPPGPAGSAGLSRGGPVKLSERIVEEWLGPSLIKSSKKANASNEKKRKNPVTYEVLSKFLR